MTATRLAQCDRASVAISRAVRGNSATGRFKQSRATHHKGHVMLEGGVVLLAAARLAHHRRFRLPRTNHRLRRPQIAKRKRQKAKLEI